MKSLTLYGVYKDGIEILKGGKTIIVSKIDSDNKIYSKNDFGVELPINENYKTEITGSTLKIIKKDTMAIYKIN